MTNFSYSGVIVRQNDVGYGVVARARLQKIVIAAFPDRSWHCLTFIPATETGEQGTERLLARIAEGHLSKARTLYREFAAARFVPEMTAYIRTLPEAVRPKVIEADDVRQAITNALKHTDVFRAAVTFEACFPYLFADSRILDTISSIMGEVDAKFEPTIWLKEAATSAEAELAEKNPSLTSLLTQYRQSEESPNQMVAG